MFVSKMLIGVIMLIRLWMIDRGCIIILCMVIFVLNTLRVLEDLSILHF
jgi:hypothetical protein